ncbi:hypothetical protein Misp01_05220 [Microtetraspora sp. NBRC 13810]|uniref:CDP-alcohol phosphatidyltransferase family protein n=1 Tax=Microtetraspora sp. NBRC 13810 TaxID=3030990 RepID=UPI0024A0C86A|nr:CDP-alcohol phosphatidyltransferase family protein [Microtetraspora sp. NBRC 13810]GLW05392.1 hypothetical protein Misp01_05220 [Microtetraspora sp. NBRC 13810]
MPDTSGPKAPQTAAVVLATTPAARLACAEGTILERLTAQLDGLFVLDLHVVARTAVAAGPRPVEAARGLVEDLRAVAKTAAAASGPVAVLPGDIVAHTDALAALLDHPARDTGALVAVGEPAGPLRPPVRAQDGRVAEAGTSFHRVTEANAAFCGVLQVGEAHLGSLARVAEELAEHVGAGAFGPVSGAEVGDLLLVGLVRSGVPVRAVPLGRLHCDRVTGQASADDAVRRLAGVDESAVRLDAAIKSDDGFVSTFLVSSWSRHLVRLAARLSLTPNAVTGISLGLAFLAAVWFSAGTRGAMMFGAALLCLSFVLDCVDGQLARYSRAFSPLGAWLDATADRAKEYMAYLGLAIGYAAWHPHTGAGPYDLWNGGPHGIWALAVAALVLQTLRHAIDFSFRASREDAGKVGAAWGTAWARTPRSLLLPDDPPARAAPAGGGVVGLSRRLEGRQASRWLKKIIVLPIGERMALIAVTAAFFDARITFLALLLWGGVAAAYTVTGRIARSLA